MTRKIVSAHMIRMALVGAKIEMKSFVVAGNILRALTALFGMVAIHQHAMQARLVYAWARKKHEQLERAQFNCRKNSMRAQSE